MKTDKNGVPYQPLSLGQKIHIAVVTAIFIPLIIPIYALSYLGRNK